jgi:hypothetical protein
LLERGTVSFELRGLALECGASSLELGPLLVSELRPAIRGLLVASRSLVMGRRCALVQLDEVNPVERHGQKPSLWSGPVQHAI